MSQLAGSDWRRLPGAHRAAGPATSPSTLSGNVRIDSKHHPLPRLTSSRPRATSLTRAGRLLSALAIVLIVAGVAGGPLLHGESRRQARAREMFRQDSVVTTAVVLRLRRSGDDNRRVTYRFTVDGRAYEGTAGVSSARFRSLRVGGPVRVRYLPAHPATHRLDGTGDGSLPVAIAFVIPALLLAAGGALIWMVNRQRWLLAEGRVTPGIIIGRKTKTSGHDTKSYAMTYQFPLLDGRKATGTSTYHRNPPAVGAVVQVLYDPEQPGRSAVYPFAWVRQAD